MTTKRKSRSKFARVRHIFLYKMYKVDGTFSVHRAFAKVIQPTKIIKILLDPDHASKSIKLKGAGDTSRCTMAVCVYGHADKFPHPVEGHVDMNYSRAFVVTKLGKDGLPCECAVYEHNRADIAQLNDNGKRGQLQLLAKLQREGPIELVLKPLRRRSKEKRPGRNRKGTGARDPMKTKGAHLRYAKYQLGAQPQA